jgi:Ca2+-binding RTX toxin-like protein
VGTYIPYRFYTLWEGVLEDRFAFSISGTPTLYYVAWGDGTADRYRKVHDLNGDGVGDVALPTHSYARDGMYDIRVRPVPADEYGARPLRAHAYTHDTAGRTLTGSLRDEIFMMGDGNDVVRTGDGLNWVSGGGGDDRIIGGRQLDILDGGAGNDDICGGFGFDILYGGDGDDRLQSGADPTRMFGGDGDDLLLVTARSATMWGDEGRDRLIGGAESDWLSGGAGADVLTGGASGDTFVFSADETARDVITDWNDDGGIYSPDRMSVADWGVSRFIGTDRFTGAGGEVRYQQNGGTTIVFADVDGDRVADFSIALRGAHVLSADDFLFF